MKEKFTVIDAGPEFVGKTVRVQKEMVSDGKSSFFVDVVRFPNSTAILPIKPNGKIVLERHYRHPVRQTILEVPAGKLEEEESPEAGARRELLEETGYATQELQSVGSVFAAPGYSTETIFLFIAKVGDKPDNNQNLEVTEKLTLEEFDLSKVNELISSGELQDAMTLSLICIAKEKKMLHSTLDQP